jgi:hypothetical protein
VKCTINKTFFLALLVALLSLSATLPAKSFTFVAGGNYLSIASDSFENNYGKKKYFPEGKLTLRFLGNLYIWGSYGWLKGKNTWVEWSNKGVPLADVDGKSVVDKTIIAGGLGFYIGYLNPGQFSIKLEAGLCSIKDDIKNTKTFMSSNQLLESNTNQFSGIGYKGTFGVTYGLFRSVFAEVTIGYLYAGETIDGERTNLGGLRASLGLGLEF